MPLPKELQDKWNKAEATGKPVKVGDVVICDICSEDYTNRLDNGGFIFGSYSYCPKCAIEGLATIHFYNEERHIKAYCAPGQSFANFVRAYRGPNATIQITKY